MFRQKSPRAQIQHSDQEIEKTQANNLKYDTRGKTPL